MREDVMKNQVLSSVDFQTGSPVKLTPIKAPLRSMVAGKTAMTANRLEDNFDDMRDTVVVDKMSKRQWLVTGGVVAAALALFYLAIRQGWIKIK